MIIASFARTGATRFCIELARTKEITFHGELAPTYLKEVGGGKAGIKASIHETGFQPIYGPAFFTDAINNIGGSNSPNEVILINKGAYLIAPKADTIILRADIKGAMMSSCKVLSRVKNITPDVVLFYTMLMYEEAYGLITYCHEADNCPPILWFENVYPNHVQNLTELNSDLKSFYENSIEKWLNISDIQYKLDDLWRNYNN